MISIIIPVYNAERNLSQCVDSVISQTYKDWELLLVNDGSQDQSGIICNKYAGRDSRIKVYHKENGGVCSARNVGLKYAQGDFITFIDSDDWVESDILERYIETYNRTHADWVRCCYVREYGDKSHVVSIDEETILYSHADIEVFVEKHRLYGFLWNSLFKKSILDGITFDENITWCEDHIFSYQYVLRCRSVAIITSPLYHYRINESASLSTQINPLIWTEATVKLYQLRMLMMDGDKEKIEERKKGCAIFISSMIFSLYKYCSYKERKEYKRKYMTHKHPCQSFFCRLFFSFVPFPIVDLLIRFRLKYIR